MKERRLGSIQRNTDQVLVYVRDLKDVYSHSDKMGGRSLKIEDAVPVSLHAAWHCRSI